MGSSRTLRRGTAFLVVLLVLLVGVYVWATRAPAIAAVDPPSFDRALVKEGEMLSRLGSCSVCHTASREKPLAGGVALPTPFGVIYSTNITPDPETGIGRWSEEAFRRAMREGLNREGEHLYPAFPYDHFTRVTDEDIAAIYAYLMAQPAVEAEAPGNELRFPYGFRPLLAGWKLLFLDKGAFRPDPELSDEQNRGAYLVEGLGHCGACHTPRNVFGAVQSDRHLGSGEAEGWHVPALGAATRAPAPWTVDAYVNYLYDGWDEAHGIAAGPMTPVVDHLYDAEEDDVFAMAAYLRALDPEPDDAELEAEVEEAVRAAAELDWSEDEALGGARSPEDPDLLRGEEIFAARCAKCHKERVAEIQPASLALTASVTAPDARNFILVVRDGIQPPYGARQRSMPGSDIAVTEEELADLAAFTRWRFTDLPPWDDVGAAILASKASNEREEGNP